MNWEAFAGRLETLCPGMEVRRQEPMAEHTTFRVGGPAALLCLPANEREVRLLLRAAGEAGVTPFFLGNGSNLLVADEGVDRLLVKLSGEFTQVRQEREELVGGGGVLLSRLSSAAQELGLTGLEFASGIPGTVGGALTMNAGAYGGEMAQVVSWVKVIDLTGKIDVLPVEDCQLSYRHSGFEDGKRLILEAGFRLKEGERETIRAAMADLAQRRREKQPLEYPSAGSTFKRPPGHFAAALIDQCGLKGCTVGGAQVSEKHTGFIINRGNATCGDVLALTEKVKRRVLDQTGVPLELEIRVLR